MLLLVLFKVFVLLFDIRNQLFDIRSCIQLVFVFDSIFDFSLFEIFDIRKITIRSNSTKLRKH